MWRVHGGSFRVGWDGGRCGGGKWSHRTNPLVPLALVVRCFLILDLRAQELAVAMQDHDEERQDVEVEEDEGAHPRQDLTVLLRLDA